LLDISENIGFENDQIILFETWAAAELDKKEKIKS